MDKISYKIKQDNIIRIINSVKATMEFEGLTASPEALEIGEKYLNGKLGMYDAIEMVKLLHL